MCMCSAIANVGPLWSGELCRKVDDVCHSHVSFLYEYTIALPPYCFKICKGCFLLCDCEAASKSGTVMSIKSRDTSVPLNCVCALHVMV